MAIRPVRVGVWGVGTWGEKHARVYASLEESELIGVFDQDGTRAREVAERHGTRACDSPDAMLRECEAISIAVPTIAHREAFERTAAAGLHGLVEKPMAPTVEDADAMLQAARRAGVQLQIGHVERFNPALLAARPHLNGPKFIEAHRLALFQPRSLDIDVVFDLMIHDVDVVLDAVGTSPEAVSAVGVAVLSENEDIANARLEFADGCVANLTASRVSQDRLRRVRFFQRDGYLSIDLFEKSCEVLRIAAREQAAALAALRAGSDPRAALAAAMASFGRTRLEVEPGEPLTLELRAFVTSLRGHGAGAASGEAGRAALRVAADVRAAMKQRARQWELRSSAVS
jgi:predicted dehydrogenase